MSSTYVTRERLMECLVNLREALVNGDPMDTPSPDFIEAMPVRELFAWDVALYELAIRALDQESALAAAQAERDEARRILVATVNETDGFAAPTVSLELLAGLPNEVRALKRERDEARAECDALRRGRHLVEAVIATAELDKPGLEGEEAQAFTALLSDAKALAKAESRIRELEAALGVARAEGAREALREAAAHIGALSSREARDLVEILDAMAARYERPASKGDCWGCHGAGRLVCGECDGTGTAKTRESDGEPTETDAEPAEARRDYVAMFEELWGTGRDVFAGVPRDERGLLVDDERPAEPPADEGSSSSVVVGPCATHDAWAPGDCPDCTKEPQP
jgi:hypothetical protein